MILLIRFAPSSFRIKMLGRIWNYFLILYVYYEAMTHSILSESVQHGFLFA